MKKLYLFFYVFLILFIANCSSHVAKNKVDKNIVQKEKRGKRFQEQDLLQILRCYGSKVEQQKVMPHKKHHLFGE